MKIRKTGLILFGLLGLAGCGTNKSETRQDRNDKNSSEKTNASVEAPSSIGGGTLTVYSAGPDGLSEKIKVTFEEKTGVKVNLFQGTTGKILSKFEAEKNNPQADVLVLASMSSMDELKKANLLQSYPEAKGKGNLNSDWTDSDGFYFGYSASALGLTYNTNSGKNPPKDWDDLSKNEWKGKVNIPDPSLSGSTLDFIYGFTSDGKKWHTVDDWFSNGIQVMGANKSALDAVITGEKEVTISGVDYMAYKAKNDGEPIDIVYPTSGTVVSPRAVGITKTSKELDASKAFVDFVLSDEGQQLVADAYLLPGSSQVEVKDRANLEEIKQIKVNWKNSDTKQSEALNKFIEIAEK